MRKKRKSLNICFMGGSQAGIIGSLTLLSRGHKLIAAVSYFPELTKILSFFKIPLYSTISNKGFLRVLKRSDILISVHGREVVKGGLLVLPRMGCINVHPYLYKYKGADPIKRAIKDKNFKGSVGVHRMEEDIDNGKVIVEEFTNVSGAKTVEDIYNKLYPYYSIAILKALDILTK